MPFQQKKPGEKGYIDFGKHGYGQGLQGGMGRPSTGLAGGRGGWPTRGQKIGGYRVGGRKKPTPDQFKNVYGNALANRYGDRRFLPGGQGGTETNPGMPRRRSQSPYMQRGYGRRFDRFRRGLGRRRPAPIGGYRGRSGSRGRGGMSGFVDPYGLARMRGYRGSRADWLQTEAGQKYQRNIDRGVMY